MKEKDEPLKENELFYYEEQEGLKILGEPMIGFECILCKETQSVPYYDSYRLPICDNCIKDLGEIIKAKRHNDHLGWE